MVLSGSATDTIAVHGIRINAANVEWDSSFYRGPDFNELDPDLQVRSPARDGRGLRCARGQPTG